MNIKILTYHRLSKGKESNRYIIEENDFLHHIELLHANGYRGISAENYYKLLLEDLTETSGRNVVITFDDGHESGFFLALPILKRYDFKGTFFITTDLIGKSGYMTKEQLVQLKEDGMSVQSHAKTHCFLDDIESNEVYDELRESRNILEDILGNKVSFVSLPGGRYNKKVIDCTRDLQYSAIFCSIPFYLKKVNDIYLIGRQMIKQPYRKNDFVKILTKSRLGEMKDKTGYYIKYLLKKMIGNKSYYFFWKKYISA